MESTGLAALRIQVLALNLKITFNANIYLVNFRHPSFKMPDLQNPKMTDLCYHFSTDGSTGFTGIALMRIPALLEEGP